MIDQCTAYDEAFIEAAKNAAAKLEEEQAFAFYDLGLLPYEKSILEQLEIDRFNIAMHAWDDDALQQSLTDFMHRLSSSGNNKHIASTAAQSVIKVIGHIIDASTYDTASIVLSTVLPLRFYDEATIQRYGLGTIDWHIDKSFPDIIHRHVHIDGIQQNYLFTLKGPSTLYYAADSAIREDFLMHSNETTITFGCTSRVECTLSGFIESSLVTSANYNQGSVHYAGWKKGAIHAAPPEEERLIVVVVPAEKTLVERYLAHFYS